MIAARRLGLCALVLCACNTSPPHQNPFDPDTPSSGQAKATLAGTVTLEAISASATLSLAGTHVAVMGAGLSADTDANGKYSIAGVAPGAYSLQATRQGYETSLIAGVTVDLSQGDQTVTVPTALLHVARGAVSGKVSLEGEASNAGVTVTLSGLDGAVTTDANGAYSFSGVPEGSYNLTATKVAFNSASASNLAVVGAQATHAPDLTLSAQPGAISGTVAVAGAASPAGVSVTADGYTLGGNHHVANGVTDVAGKFSLTPIPAGTYQVAFQAPDYVTQTTSVTVAPNGNSALPIVSLAKQTGSVAGVAKLAGSSDSSGITVALTAQGAPAAAANALTDTNGGWRIDGIPVGQYTIAYAKSRGYVATTGTVTVLRDTTVQAAPVQLAAVPALVQGVATMEGVAPGGDESQIQVLIESTTLQTATAQDGSWSIFGIGAGTQTLVFQKDGFDTQRVQVIVGPGDVITLFPVALPLSRGTISGAYQLLNVGAGNWGGILVTVSGPTWSGSAVTDSTGSFSLAGVPLGTYSVTARKDPDWMSSRTDGQSLSVSGGAVSLAGSPIMLAPLSTSSIAGVVALEGTAAAGGTSVTLTGADFTGSSVSTSASSAADGSYSFSGLVAGSYSVAFLHAGYDAGAAVPVSVASASSAIAAPARLALSRGGFSGQIRLANVPSGGWAGIVVTVSNGAGQTYGAVTDGTGSFSIPGVPLGTWSIAISKPPDWQGVVVSGESLTASGQGVTLAGSPVTLQPVATASIAGSVALEGQSDGSGTSVNLTGTDFTGAAVGKSTATASDGSYAFTALAAGNYSISFLHGGFDAGAALSVSVPSGGNATAPSATLAIGRGSIQGVYRLAGVASGNWGGVVVSVTGNGFSAGAVTDGTGHFTVTGVPVGSGYSVTASDAPDWNASSTPGQSVAAAGSVTTVTGSPITLTPVATAAISGAVSLEGLSTGSWGGTGVTLTGTDFTGAAVNRSATSAADGTYSFTALVAGTYSIAFSHPGYDSGAALSLGVASTVSAAASATKLLMSRGTIEGIYQLSGVASGGWGGILVSVTGNGFSSGALTDVTGHFSIAGVPVGSGYSVTALDAPDWNASSTSGQSVAASGSVTTVTGSPITLTPVASAAISGVVSLEGLSTGSWNGTGVTLTGTDFRGAAVSRSTTSATNGAWSFTALVAGSYSVTFSHAGYDPGAALSLNLASGVAATAPSANLPISRGAIQGTFQLSGIASGGWAGIVVGVSGNGFSASAVTDGAGHFSVTGVPVGSGYSVTASKAPDWSASVTAGQSVPSSGAVTTVTGSPLTLSPVAAAVISGVVSLEGLNTGAWNGTGVTLTGTDFTGAVVSKSTTSAADGTYSFTALVAGSYSLAFSHTGYDSGAALSFNIASSASAAAPSTRLPISRGSIQGTYQLQSVASGGWAGIVVGVSGNGFSASAVTDATGSFTVTGVPVGSGYSVTASKAPDWNASSTSGQSVSSGAITTVTGSPLSLTPVAAASISGVVSLEGLNTGSWNGTGVTLTGTDFTGAVVNKSATSATDGTYAFTALVAGSYSIAFAHAGYDSGAALSFNLATGASSAAPSTNLLISRGSIQGVYQLSGVSSGGWGGIVVAVSGNGFSASAVTDGAGHFSIGAVPAGTGYSVTASKAPDWSPSSTTGQNVAAGAATTVTGSPLSLTAVAASSIAGVVSLEGLGTGSWNGTGVTLTGMDFTGAAVNRSTTSASNGSYAFTALVAGNYAIAFAHAGYDPGPALSLNVASSASASAPSTSLLISRGAIEGVYQLSGIASGGWAGIVVGVSGNGFSASAVTDATGHFSVTGIPVGSGYSVTAARAPDWTASSTSGQSVASGAVTTVTGSPIALTAVAASTISGVVSLEGQGTGSWNGTGVTLTGADFTGAAVSKSTTSGTDGSYSFGSLLAGSYAVAFSHSSYDPGAALTLNVASSASATAPSTKLLLSRGAIQGVYQLSGIASGGWAGIVVSVSGNGFSASAVTDATGHFTVPGVPVGSGYSVTATDAPDWNTSSTSGQSVASSGSVTTVTGSPITLSPVAAASISGVVSLEGLATGSWNGTSVTLAGTDFRGAAVNRSTTSATDGSYSFASLVAGTYTVAFAHTSYDPGAGIGLSLTSSNSVTAAAVSLALSRGSFTGQIKLAGIGGGGWAGIVVSASNGASSSFGAVTDSNGNFAITGVPLGTWSIAAGKQPDWQTATVAGQSIATSGQAVTVTGSPLTLSPVANSTISGVVTLEGQATGNWNGTTVNLTGADFTGASVSKSTSSAGDGGYAFTSLVAGSYSITFSRASYDAGSGIGVSVTSSTSVAAAATRLNLSRGSFTGVVQLAGVSSGGWAGIVVNASNGAGTSFGAVTDAAGNFAITGVPLGTWSIAAGKQPDWQSTAVPGQTLTASGQTVAVTGSPLALQPVATAAISGAFTVEGNPDGSGTSVALSGADFTGASVSLSTTTAANGSFSFGSLVAGSYTVSATHAGYVSPQPLPVSVASGGSASVGSTQLAIARGSLTGVFRLAGLSAGSWAGTSVNINGLGTVGQAYSATSVTDANGNFSFTGVPLGTNYTVTASNQPNWATSTAVTGVTVPGALPGSPLTLQPLATSSIAGTVTLEGQSSGTWAGTVVTLTGTDFRGVAVTGVPQFTTLSDGAWSFTGLRAGSYSIAFSHTGFDAGSGAGVSVTAASAATVASIQLAISRGGAGGTVTATGASDQSGSVVVVTGPVTASAVTNGSGVFNIASLPVGSYNAVASRAGYAASSSVPFTVTANATAALSTITIAPSTGGSIAGVITLERTATNHAGISVSYSGIDLNGAPVGASNAATTNGTGNFTLGGLRQGTYALTFSMANYDPVTLTGIAVASNTATSLTPSPAATLKVSKGTITGTASLTASPAVGFSVGTDFSGIQVALSGTDFTGFTTTATAFTASNGSFQFTGIPLNAVAVPYTVTASKTNFVPANTSAQVNGSAATISALQVNVGTVGGTVTLNDNAGGAGPNANWGGASITLSGTAFNGTGYQAITTSASGAPGGTWQLSNVPPGTYSVVATSQNRSCAALGTGSLPPGGNLSAGSTTCSDILPPTGMTLGAPATPPGAQQGFVNTSTVTAALVAAATDPTTPASNLRGYQLAVTAPGASQPFGPCPGSNPGCAVLPDGANNFTFAGLSPGANTLWARAIDWSGNAGPAAQVNVQYLASPPAPPVINSISAEQGSLTVTWTPSVSSTVAYYLLQYGSSAGITTGTGASQGPSPLNVGNVSTFRLTGLASGTPYYISLVAVDSSGNKSTPSAERLAVPNEINSRLVSSIGGALHGIGARGSHLYVGENQAIVQLDVSNDTVVPAAVRVALPDVVPDNQSPMPSVGCTVGGVAGDCIYVAGTTEQGAVPNNGTASSYGNLQPGSQNVRAQVSIVFFPSTAGAGAAAVVGTVPEHPSSVHVVSASGQQYLVTTSLTGIRIYSLANPINPAFSGAALASEGLGAQTIRFVRTAGSVGSKFYFVYMNMTNTNLRLLEFNDVTQGHPAVTDRGDFKNKEGINIFDAASLFTDRGIFLFYAVTSDNTPWASSYTPPVMTAQSSIQLETTPNCGGVGSVACLMTTGGAPTAAFGNHLYAFNLFGPETFQGWMVTTNAGGVNLTSQVRLDGGGEKGFGPVSAIAFDPGNGEHVFDLSAVLYDNHVRRWSAGSSTTTRVAPAKDYVEINGIDPAITAWSHFLFVGTGAVSSINQAPMIRTIDVSNPAQPRIVSVFTDTRADASSVSYSRLKVFGNNLYAACQGGNGWVEVFSIAPNGALTFTNFARPAAGTPMQAWDIGFTWPYMFVAQGTSATGMPYFLLTDPSNPAFQNVFDTTVGTHNVTALEVVWNYVYTAGAYGFQVIPWDASTVAAIPLPVIGSQPTHVVVSGTKALVSDTAGTTMIDVANPRAPVFPAAAPPFFGVAGPALYQEGYVVGPSPQFQTDGLRWLSADTSDVVGTLPYAQCLYGGNFFSQRAQLAYSDGLYYSACQANGIQVVSPINPSHSSLMWDDQVSSAWANSGGNAMALDHSRLLFSEVGSLKNLWSVNVSDVAGGVFPAAQLYTAPSAPVPSGQPVALNLRSGLLFATTFGSPASKIEPFEASQESGGPFTAFTPPLTLTSGFPWHEPFDDGRYLWVPETNQIDLVDTNAFPGGLILKTPISPEASNQFNGSAVVYRGRLYASEVFGATCKIGVWDVSNPGSPLLKTAVAAPVIPSGILFRVMPTAVVGSTIFFSYQLDNADWGWGMAQLSSDGDGKTSGVTTPAAALYSFPSTFSIREMIVAGDTLLVQENMGVTVYDLSPFWRSGAAPVKVSGQSLPDPFYPADHRPVLKLEGPFAYLSAERLRAFDLR